MKLLHIGDVHLGKRQYRSDIRYNDHFDTFQESVELAVDQDVEAVIQTGDLFDTSNPSIETISRCIDILSTLTKNDIPFYAIVGNHERKRKEQWLDVINRIGKASRLTKTPEILEDSSTSVALYGIDAVRKPQWNTKDFTLEDPNREVDTNILCMHELVSPPITGDNTTGMETYACEDLLDRFERDINTLALGDFHVPVDAYVNNTYVYYAGATERTSKNQSKAVVSLLTISDSGELDRNVIDLGGARPFTSTELVFENGDGIEFVRTELENHDFDPPGKKRSVGVVTLKGKDTGVTISEIERVLQSDGAAVTHILDRRETATDVTITPDDLDEPDDTIDDRIDESIADIDMDETSEEIEEIIRDTDDPDYTVRDQVNSILNPDNEGDKE